jgi:hypothetical protein
MAGWRPAVWVLALALCAACSGEAECNNKKVAASDAWNAVADALADPCRELTSPMWGGLEQVGLAALRSIAVGRSSENGWAADLALCWERYQPTLQRACRGAQEARAAAPGGALRARDASRDARTGIRGVLDKHVAFFECVQKAKSSSVHRYIPLAQAHSAAVAESGLGGLLSKADIAADESFEACKGVSP